MAADDAQARALTARRYEKMRPMATSRTSVALEGLPPGPRWPAILQSIALLRFRHQFVPWAHRRYGDVFTVRVLPQGRPLVLFTRPEHAREIFAGDPEVFHAGKGNAILGPIARLLSLPLMVVTLGLFAFVVNGLLFLVVDWIVDALDIDGLLPAIGGALVLTIVDAIIGWVFSRTPMGRRVAR